MNVRFKDGLTIRDASATDITEIAINMRRSDIDEIWASHHHLPLKALTIAFYTSTLCFTAEYGGKRIAMFGVVPESFLGSRASVWLLGTKDFAKASRNVIRHSRGMIRYLLQHYQHLTNYVDARNETSITWLRKCGAEIEEAKPFGEDKLLFHKFTFKRGAYALAS